MIKVLLKNIIEKIPYPFGSLLSKIPFSLRLGKDYNAFKTQINTFETLEKKEQYVIEKFNAIFQYAKVNFPFYQEFYEKEGVMNLEIKTLDDIKKVPILNKSDIRHHTHRFKGALKINTGGTTGEPFSFYVDKNAFAREWAHMHKIWRLKGYSYKDIKVTLRGKDLGKRNIIYNPVHNEFIINTYRSVEVFKNELVNLFSKREIKFIHGYPSAVYNFLKELEHCLSKEEKKIITKNLKACLLGSEFPTPIIKKYIDSVWGLDYISWYGHSEMCILAYDAGNNKYAPFYTYGFAEVDNNRLIGTSYFNKDMPLIRYNTGDLVSPNYSKNGLLKNFSIKEGREGEFIVDKSGKKIPLTALIFGRHHKAFDVVDFVQVKQNQTSLFVTFYLITKNKKIETDGLLNLDNILIDYTVEVIENPIKTKLGKVQLKVK